MDYAYSQRVVVTVVAHMWEQIVVTATPEPGGEQPTPPPPEEQPNSYLNTTGTLRLDLSFRVAHGSDLAKAKESLANLLVADERVLAEPPAFLSSCLWID